MCKVSELPVFETGYIVDVAVQEIVGILFHKIHSICGWKNPYHGLDRTIALFGGCSNYQHKTYKPSLGIDFL